MKKLTKFFIVIYSLSLLFIGGRVSAQQTPLPDYIADTSESLQKIRLKIMPLGDSITFGTRDPSYGGYRHLLGTLLTNDGYIINFVGSRRSGNRVIHGLDNEGHPGWTIPQIKKGIDSEGWLKTYQPDIILLHIGTNDLRQGNVASAPSNLSALLGDILVRLPQTHVIVAQIIPFRRGPDRSHKSYNASIAGIVASKGPRVSMVDMQNILSPSDYADGLHPNASGYDKMARVWELAIRAVLSRSTQHPEAQPSPSTSAGEDVKPAVPTAPQDMAISPSTQAIENHITYVQGSSKKVCQLTGQLDHETHQPTVNQTVKRFGLIAADLGYSFEHHGKLFFLFGDALPSPTFRGKPNRRKDPPRLLDDDDAIAFTTDTRTDQCPRLDFITNTNGAYKSPVVLNADGQPAITLRTNEMPISGISEGGRMYVIFGTDNILSNPPGGPRKPNGGPTRSVMAVSDDDARTFHYLYDVSKGPGAKFIYGSMARGLDGYIYFWGAQGGALYRRSAPYFARKRAELLDRPGEMEYFTGASPGGQPRFSSSEADASPLFEDYLDGSSEPHNCMANFSVQWNPFVHHWVMLYSCSNRTRPNLGGIWMRLAEQPWGPWSAPQTIFNAERDGGLCHFIHRAVNGQNPTPCDDLSPPERQAQSGGNYAPYLISRFTTGDEARGTSTFYYTMSTWNPYGQVIVKSTIQDESKQR